MASVLIQETVTPQSYPKPFRFTVHDFHAIIEAGVFDEGDRLELIDGEIFAMTPIVTPHAACVRTLTYLLHKETDSVSVDVQNPLRLNEEIEVYPDLTVLRDLPNAYANRIPNAADTLLVIEVSDSTLRFDRTVKLSRYAEAGVPEVWIVDLAGERVLVHLNPLDGVYGQVEEVKKDGELSVAALDSVRIKVADIL